MNILSILLPGAVALAAPLYAQSFNDSTSHLPDKEMELGEVVVVAKRAVLKQSPDRITYIVKNDKYTVGLDALTLLDRIPRINVQNDIVTVAGKATVKYIIDGHLLEMPEDALKMKLKGLLFKFRKFSLLISDCKTLRYEPFHQID